MKRWSSRLSGRSRLTQRSRSAPQLGADRHAPELGPLAPADLEEGRVAVVLEVLEPEVAELRDAHASPEQHPDAERGPSVRGAVQDRLDLGIGVGGELLLRNPRGLDPLQRRVHRVPLAGRPVAHRAEAQERAADGVVRPPRVLQLADVALELGAGQVLERGRAAPGEVEVNLLLVPAEGAGAAALDLEVEEPLGAERDQPYLARRTAGCDRLTLRGRSRRQHAVRGCWRAGARAAGSEPAMTLRPCTPDLGAYS